MQTEGVYEDLDRPALRPASLQRSLAPDGWRVEVVASTGSTNADVASRAGEPAGLVVVAEHQHGGRGRLDRAWVSPPRAGLTFSALLRPELSPEAYGWLPLWTGLAVAEVVEQVAGVGAVLKWPNDVLIRGKKVCGILAQRVGPDAVVLGIGLNVTTRADELPGLPATSLHLAGATNTDRATLLAALLRRLTATLDDPDGARSRYRERCDTLGREVRLELPGGAPVTGTATSVAVDGRLVVDEIPYAAGDVVHLRPAASQSSSDAPRSRDPGS